MANLSHITLCSCTLAQSNDQRASEITHARHCALERLDADRQAFSQVENWSEESGQINRAAGRKLMTNNYHCYFTDASDRIQSFEPIECPDDATAVLKVDELLATSKYNTAELWQGKRLVGRWGTDFGNVDAKPKINSEQTA
jgi:hypothetical protein